MIRKDQTVGARLPTDLVGNLEAIEQAEQSTRSTVIRRLVAKAGKDWQKKYWVQQYPAGVVSPGRSADEADISL